LARPLPDSPLPPCASLRSATAPPHSSLHLTRHRSSHRHPCRRRLLSPPRRRPSQCSRCAALGTNPSRPTSPRTRFAPTLRHSATWASPPSDRSVLSPSRPGPASAPLPPLMPRASGRHRSLRFRQPASRHGPCVSLQPRARRQRPDTHTARRHRRHRPAHAVRLATLALGAAAHVRVASAGSARHWLPLPAAPRVRNTAHASARASGAALRASAVGSVSTLGTPRFTPSGSGAADDDADRRPRPCIGLQHLASR